MVNIAKLVSTVKKGLSSKEAKEFLEMMKKKMPQGKTLKRDKVKESASTFVKRRKQLRGAGKSKGNTAGTLTTYGVGVAAGSGATMLGMKKKKKKRGK